MSEQNKHTPGPWSVHCSHIYAPDGAIIAVVHNPGSNAIDYPLVANRNLIAAAPDLLEALEALLANVECDPALECELCDQARSAIAKAKGGGYE